MNGVENYAAYKSSGKKFGKTKKSVNKLKHFETKYRRACTYLDSTVLSIFSYFSELDEVFGDRVSNDPPFRADSITDVDAEELLFPSACEEVENEVDELEGSAAEEEGRAATLQRVNSTINRIRRSRTAVSDDEEAEPANQASKASNSRAKRHKTSLFDASIALGERHLHK
ncbi:hypothetical protein EC973_009468 [Apophysomyces ossiformis]|uniref:Uncharacterized protein n=1 Tax=Apophysomyces ossiformis TaxID=679940 RepID=A0A8H7BLL6_9FUNG|nr:hypothetical protein EC973_009468 [Apophysomyces ossiformis]